MSNRISGNELQAIEVVVRGRVQGVGFRAFTRRNAMLLGLRGEVCNQSDGTVRAYIEGDKARIDQMLHLLRDGPSLARVDRIDVIPMKASGKYSTFEVGLRV